MAIAIGAISHKVVMDNSTHKVMNRSEICPDDLIWQNSTRFPATVSLQLSGIRSVTPPGTDWWLQFNNTFALAKHYVADQPVSTDGTWPTTLTPNYSCYLCPFTISPYDYQGPDRNAAWIMNCIAGYGWKLWLILDDGTPVYGTTLGYGDPADPNGCQQPNAAWTGTITGERFQGSPDPTVSVT
jgi:hypothetical protein